MALMYKSSLSEERWEMKVCWRLAGNETFGSGVVSTVPVYCLVLAIGFCIPELLNSLPDFSFFTSLCNFASLFVRLDEKQ